MSPDHRQILVAEDDADDRMLLGEAFGASGYRGSLEFVPDGVELIERLQRPDRPDLVLLDLNMPRLGGLDALQALRSREELRELPIIVLTTSGASCDVAAAYQRGANTYLRKPRSFRDLVDMTQLLQRYWLECASLPNESPN